MKRRSFLAAVAPIVALAAPAYAQNPATDTTGRLKPGGAARPAVPAAPAAAPNPAKAAQGPTEITAQEAMLDNKANLAVFSGAVDVKSPEYDVNCDKLTIYLKPEKPKAVDVKPAEPRPIGAEEKPALQPAEKPEDKVDEKGGEKGKSNSRIDKAIAEGNVKIVQNKPGANGGKPEKYFGSGRKAVFDNEKQTCTLTGWPRVQQSEGGKLVREIVPLEEGVVIIMKPDRIDVLQGRATTRLLDETTLESPKAGDR
jgi:lipopolysaccharide export system protein LptA